MRCLHPVGIVNVSFSKDSCFPRNQEGADLAGCGLRYDRQSAGVDLAGCGLRYDRQSAGGGFGRMWTQV